MKKKKPVDDSPFLRRRTERAIPVMSISTFCRVLELSSCLVVGTIVTVGGSMATAFSRPTRRPVVENADLVGAWKAAAVEAETKSETAMESFICS